MTSSLNIFSCNVSWESMTGNPYNVPASNQQCKYDKMVMRMPRDENIANYVNVPPTICARRFVGYFNSHVKNNFDIICLQEASLQWIFKTPFYEASRDYNRKHVSVSNFIYEANEKHDPIENVQSLAGDNYLLSVGRGKDNNSEWLYTLINRFKFILVNQEYIVPLFNRNRRILLTWVKKISDERDYLIINVHTEGLFVSDIYRLLREGNYERVVARKNPDPLSHQQIVNLLDNSVVIVVGDFNLHFANISTDFHEGSYIYPYTYGGGHSHIDHIFCSERYPIKYLDMRKGSDYNFSDHLPIASTISI